VDRPRQVVGLARRPQVEVEHRVDDEVLAVAALLRQHAVVPSHAQPGERDPVAATRR
jgi:hypothetical protein